MAYIKERPRAFLVCWRDPETGKTKAHSVSWGNPYREGTIGREVFSGPLTREEARAAAESLRLDVESRERRSVNALNRQPNLIEKLTGQRYKPMFGPGWNEPGDVLDVYLRQIIDQDTELRQASRETYMAGLRSHIEGTTLGRSRLDMVTPDMVREFWTALSKKGAGVGARRNVYLLLSKAFTRAVKDEIIAVSPLLRADIRQPSKARREEIVPLTVAEVEALADATRNPRDRLAVLLMAYGGLRAGEVGGLRAQDIDFTKCKLSIRQQVVQTHRERKIAPLKTQSARRTINVACSVTEEMEAFVSTSPPPADGRIFRSASGGLWAHAAINHMVQAAAVRAGLRPVHSHMLRHTAVSLLIDDGANPKAIQVFVGHARIQETLDTYGHLFDSGGEALAESMERRRDAYRNGGEAAKTAGQN